MNGFDRQRLVAALMLAATALFLIAQRVPSRYRRALQIAAITVFAVVFTGVAVWVVLWWLGIADN
jgi:hypothetical protein